jgi:hypothetical protein
MLEILHYKPAQLMWQDKLEKEVSRKLASIVQKEINPDQRPVLMASC